MREPGANQLSISPLKFKCVLPASPKFPLRSSSLPFVSLQVADQYAFIPREAISKFLLFCIDCQRKNSMENRRATNGNGGIKAGKDCRAEDNGSPLNSSLGGDTPTPNDYRPLSPPPSLVIDHFRHSPISLNGTNGTQAGMQHVLTTAAVAGGVASLTSTPHLSPPTTPKSASPASSSAALSVTAAAAFTQAMAAMQNHPLRSLQMRNTLLAANPQSNPFLATQALLPAGGNNAYLAAANQTALLNSAAAANTLNKFNPDGIDLSLPITSTYLRRMRALGLATAGFESSYRHLAGTVSSFCHVSDV